MHIEKSDEFAKDYKKLCKKYLSIPEDIKRAEELIRKFPLGKDESGTRLFRTDPVRRDDAGKRYICKMRVRCQALKNSDCLRLIYYYNGQCAELLCIELYFKGNKDNEDFARVEEYWQACTSE